MFFSEMLYLPTSTHVIETQKINKDRRVFIFMTQLMYAFSEFNLPFI
jgi:hypothetical protein